MTRVVVVDLDFIPHSEKKDVDDSTKTRGDKMVTLQNESNEV